MLGTMSSRHDTDQHAARISRTSRTACALDCPDRCAILVEHTPESSARLRLSGDPTHPSTKGILCRKIRRYPERLDNPERIRHPWMRTEGRSGPFRPATWDEAMSAAAGAIARARLADPASIIAIRSAGAMGAGKEFVEYLFGLLGARPVVGSLCDVAGIEAVKADAGSLAMNDPSEIDRADAIVLWGKNPRASSVHTAAQVVEARRRGARILAVTPDAAGLVGLADHIISIRPGRDRFLALAVSKLLLSETEPSWERASGRDDLEALISRFTLGDLLAACDVSEADARLLAAQYAATRRVATIVGWGLQRYVAGGETVRAIHAVAFLAGTLGVEGGGFYFNISSSGGFTQIGPLLREADALQERTPLLRETGATRERTPPLRLPLLGGELPSADPPVRVAWLTATNIVNQGPDSGALKAAFEGIETVVAVEAFWTETARTATIVLPPALWLEEEDIVGSAWRRELAAVRRVVDPQPGCRTDFDILQDLAVRLGVSTPYASLDDWLRARLPGGSAQLEELRARGHQDPGGDTVAWRHGFDHPDGRFRLLSTVTPPLEEDHDLEARAGGGPSSSGGGEYPLHLLTLIRGGAMHSQMTADEQVEPLAIRLHPSTAAACCVKEGTAVRVVSRVGTLTGLLRLDPGLNERAVACPRGGWVEHGLGVNVATEAAVTDMGDGAAYYSTTVRVESA